MLALQTVRVAAAPAQTGPAFAVRVLDLTNEERQKVGLRPLVLSSELSEAAQEYSQVLATTGCFEHACGPVPNFADRVGQSGYVGWTALAENIAAGYPTAEAVVSAWMGSGGHRANILSPTYSDMGVGMVSGTGQLGTYWTEDFGARIGVGAAQPDMPVDDSGTTDDGGGSGG